MGYKILDVKADIHEDVEAYFEKHWGGGITVKGQMIKEDVLDIVDEHFKKIERK